MARAAKARIGYRYSVHPGVAMVQKWVSELKSKTGRSLDEWLSLIQKQGPNTAKERRAWLKAKYQLGTNGAWWLVDRAEGKRREEDTPEAYLEAAERYVQQQYSGAKAALKPIYDELAQLGASIGADAKICPCQTMVPLYREHVFGQIKPTTNSRIDLGLALTHYRGKLPKRLIDTGGLRKKDRITHRIEIRCSSDIDEDVKKWLRTAYDLDKPA
jgi:hypothetical protein